MSTKKVFIELVHYLETNKDLKISDVLKAEEFLELIVAKKNANTVLKDLNDNVVAIFCYYHKRWELLSEVEYGSKVSHWSGFNTMCKIGVNKWTKQQAVAKQAKVDLLDSVAEGKVQVADVSTLIDEIENARNAIDMVGAPKGSKKLPLIEVPKAESSEEDKK